MLQYLEFMKYNNVDGTQKSRTEHDFDIDFGEWAAVSLSV